MEQKTQIQIVGTIEDVGPVQTYGKFSKRQLIVKVDEGKWPQYFPVTCKGEGVRMAEGFAVGDVVKVSAYVNSNRWQKKDEAGKPVGKVMYFVEIAAGSIEEFKEADSGEQGGEPDGGEGSGEYVPDDLPF